MKTIVEASEFQKQASKLLSDDERHALINLLAASPCMGDVISGTGGFRILRFARQDKGKSGGVRVIYFYHEVKELVLIAIVYAKGTQDNLSAAQKATLHQFATAIKGAK